MRSVATLRFSTTASGAGAQRRFGHDCIVVHGENQNLGSGRPRADAPEQAAEVAGGERYIDYHDGRAQPFSAFQERGKLR